MGQDEMMQHDTIRQLRAENAKLKEGLLEGLTDRVEKLLKEQEAGFRGERNVFAEEIQRLQSELAVATQQLWEVNKTVKELNKRMKQFKIPNYITIPIRTQRGEVS